MRLKVVPKNLQVILLQPRHPIQTQEFLLAADCWYRDAHFLNEMQLICACLSERKIYNDLILCLKPIIQVKWVQQPALRIIFRASFWLPITILLCCYLRLSQSYKPKSRRAFEENETVSYSRSLQSNNIFSPHRVHTVQRNWETLQQGECKNTIVGLELQVGSNQTGLCSKDSSFSQREGFVFILW